MRPPPGFGRLPGASANDFYSVLGVTRTAPKKAIKKAFVDLAKIHHPDHNSAPEAVEEFRKIQAAYSILSNEQKRKEYDLSLPKSKDLRRSRFFDRNTRFKPGDTPFPGAAYGFEPPHKEHWRYQQGMRDRAEKTHNYTQYRATPDFDAQRFQHKLFRNLWRAWPVMIPVWFFFVFFALRPKQAEGNKGPGNLRFDKHGRAYEVDIYGNLHRASDYDQPTNAPSQGGPQALPPSREPSQRAIPSSPGTTRETM